MKSGQKKSTETALQHYSKYNETLQCRLFPPPAVVGWVAVVAGEYPFGGIAVVAGGCPFGGIFGTRALALEVGGN